MIITFSINFLLPSIRIESSDGTSTSITVILLLMISRLKLSTGSFFTKVFAKFSWENTDPVMVIKRINKKIFFFIFVKVYVCPAKRDRRVNWFLNNYVFKPQGYIIKYLEKAGD